MITDFQLVDVGIVKYSTFAAAKKRLDPDAYTYSEMGFGADLEDALKDLFKNMEGRGISAEGLEARIAAETDLSQEPRRASDDNEDESYFVGLRWN